MHRFCAEPQAPPPRAPTNAYTKGAAQAMHATVAWRLIALAALVLSLLLTSCASRGVRTAEDEKGWERCDGSWPQNLTFVCFRR